MTSRVSLFKSPAAELGTRLALGSRGLTVLSFAIEMSAIVAVAVLTGVGYHLFAYDSIGPVPFYFRVGGLAALIYMLPFLMAEQYRVQDFLEGRRSSARSFLLWNYTFLSLAILAFLTKTTEDFSRAWVALFYVVGLVTIVGLEGIFRRLCRMLMEAGRINTRRMMLVGAADEIRSVASDGAIRRSGASVVATIALPRIGGESARDVEAETMRAALQRARDLKVNDVVILIDWSRADLMERIVESFSALPIEIHLGASSLVGRFSDARVSRFASLTTLSLTAPAMEPLQSVAKRVVDLIGSALALLMLSPVLLVIAGLIKLDSKGPVFFRQRRSGFNQQEFLIWKFRSMTTQDDGDRIAQARANDARVTRLGHYLRRYSLDELPQLINVFKGEMSLVGPRPHAVAHDRLYSEVISSYSRRLNVLPGITGWAQINGARGLTETDEAMRRRVELDLYYIDNWSILFDLYILAMTLLSPKTHQNAH